MICPKRLIPCMDDMCYGGTTLCGFNEGLEVCRKCRQVTPDDELNVFGICLDCREEEPEDDYGDE